jgi:hypothetical protein
MAIHIRRREFIVTLGGAVAAWPLAARAQQIMPVVGYLDFSSPRPIVPLAFGEGLAVAGFVEGRNVTIESAQKKAICVSGIARRYGETRPKRASSVGARS